MPQMNDNSPELGRLQFLFEPLQLNVTLVERQVERVGQPDLDSLICEVVASVSHFSAQFQWRVMAFELEDLADTLSKFYTEYPNPTKVDLHFENGIALTFEMTKTGHILGHFVLRPNAYDDTHLEGSFQIEQSYLLTAESNIRAFLKASTDFIRPI